MMLYYTILLVVLIILLVLFNDSGIVFVMSYKRDYYDQNSYHPIGILLVLTVLMVYSIALLV